MATLLIYVSDRFLGRCDYVPEVCYVETEFVCAYGFPILPRRSALAIFDGYLYKRTPIPLSLKSVLFGYLRAACVVLGVLFLLVSAIMAWDWIHEASRPLGPKEIRAALPYFEYARAALRALSPWIVLIASYRLSRPSRARRRRLAEIPGVPMEIAQQLRSDSSTERGVSSRR